MACDVYAVGSPVYLGRDNPKILIPYSDVRVLENYDMTDVTRVVVTADLTTSTTPNDALSANSVDDPNTVWFNDDAGEWRIFARLGRIASLTAGEYNFRFIIEEPGAPNGVVVADSIQLTVVGEP